MEVQLRFVLNDLGPRKVKKALLRVPKDLKDAYNDVLRRIKKNKCLDDVLKILSWLFRAHRILTMAELRDAIVVEPGEPYFNATYLLEPASVVAWCQGLVSYDEASGRVELSHFTVHEFLKINSEIAPLSSDLDLVKVCLTYLTFRCEELETRPFYSYAACFWQDHARGQNEMQNWTTICKFMVTELSAGVDVRDVHKRTALHETALIGHTEAVKVLLDAHADADALDCAERTALHNAAENGHTDVVALLLNANAAQTGRFKEKALHLAARYGHKDVVELLLRENPDLYVLDCAETTALHNAASSGHRDVVELLLNANVDVDAMDGAERTALQDAASSGHRDVVELLLNANADVDAKDGAERTALQDAAASGHRDVVELVLRANADVDARHFGGTALHLAAENGDTDVVELLLNANADVDAQTGYQATALHLAARYGHKDMVKLLLRANADVDALDGAERTALHRAARCGHRNVVELFKGKWEQ